MVAIWVGEGQCGVGGCKCLYVIRNDNKELRDWSEEERGECENA